jgi:ABC-2 type transport system permease protein
VLAGLVGVPYDPLMIAELLVLLFIMSFMITALGLVLAARVKQVQSAMPLVQMIITPLMFLSGALFPLSRLPAWLTVVTHLNPMTYAVEPVRAAVFERLTIPAEARAILDPGIWWGSYQVPVWMQVGLVVLATMALLFAAVKLFNRTE